MYKMLYICANALTNACACKVRLCYSIVFVVVVVVDDNSIHFRNYNAIRRNLPQHQQARRRRQRRRRTA